MSKPHYYSQHATALRAELGQAVPRDLLRALHERSAVRHLAVALRQFAILVACTWALVRFDHPLVWMPLALVQGFTVFNFTVLLHEVVHHAVFAAAPAGAPSGCSASSTRSRAASRPRSSRAGTSTTTRSWGPTSTTRSGTICRRRSTRAGTSCSTRRRRCSRSTSARPGARRPPTRRDLQRRIAAERRLAIAAHLAVLAAIWWLGGAAAALRAYVVPGLLRLPDRVRAQPARAALRHRPGRPGEVGDADARPLVLGRRVPQLELPPRAPLLPGRAVLPPAGAAAGAHAVLRAARLPLAVATAAWCGAGSSRTGRRTPTGRAQRRHAARRAPAAEAIAGCR